MLGNLKTSNLKVRRQVSCELSYAFYSLLIWAHKKEYMVCCHLFSEDEYSSPASVCMDSDSNRERDTQAKELQALLKGKPKGKAEVPAEAKQAEEKGKCLRTPKKKASIRGKHGKQQGRQKKNKSRPK